MTTTAAKSALIEAHRNGGDVLAASLAFTRAKRTARRYGRCKICGVTIAGSSRTKGPGEHCQMHSILHRVYGTALTACLLLFASIASAGVVNIAWDASPDHAYLRCYRVYAMTNSLGLTNAPLVMDVNTNLSARIEFPTNASGISS